MGHAKNGRVNEKMNLDTARVITSDTRRETTVKRHNCPHARAAKQPESEDSNGRCGWFLRTWFVVNSMVAGLLAVIWLILRSGPKPSRLAYPCQQAAFSAASLAFAAPLISALIAARRGLVQGMRTPAAVAASLLGLIITLGMWGHSSLAGDPETSVLVPPPDYRAQVYRVTDCPQQPVGDRFIGLDNLLTLMGSQGLKFYRSASPSPLAGPAGIIATDDVVVIKINYQWGERGGTNTEFFCAV